jgi:hypothetical protein
MFGGSARWVVMACSLVACTPRGEAGGRHAERVDTPRDDAAAARQAAITLATPLPPMVPDPVEWTPMDALPPGAMRRFGTRQLATTSERVGVTEDGTLWLIERHRGLVAVRLDGRQRFVAPMECGVLGAALVTVDDVVRVQCDREIIEVNASGVVRHRLGHAVERCAWSADGETLGCAVRDDSARAPKGVAMFDARGKQRWEAPFGETIDRLAPADPDTLLVDGARKLHAIRGGRVAWSRPLAVNERLPAVRADTRGVELFGFAPREKRWVRRELATGREIGQSPQGTRTAWDTFMFVPHTPWILASLDPDRARKQTADGKQAATGKPTAAGPLMDTRVGLVDPTTGAVVRDWPPLDSYGDVGVSSRGTWAAVVDGRRAMRIALDGSRIDRPGPTARQVALAISPRGDRLASITRHSGPDELTVFDARTGATLLRRDVQGFVTDVAFSPDGARVAMASSNAPLQIADAKTGDRVCTADAGSPAWLRWNAHGIVTLDHGSIEAKCLPAIVQTTDAACAPVGRTTFPGRLDLLDETPGALVLSAARWTEPCRDGSKLQPADASIFDRLTGTSTAGPAAIVAGYAKLRTAIEKTETAVSGLRVLHTRHLPSTDESTFVTFMAYARPARPRGVLRCFDAHRPALLATHALPDGAGVPLAVAQDGSWIAIAHGPSILAYPCRPTGRAPGSAPGRGSEVGEGTAWLEPSGR